MAGLRSSGLLTATILMAVAVCVTVSAEERSVPSQYSTIQAAIDDANNGDIVVIAPGTYKGAGNTNLTFRGKAITVRSADPNDPNTVAATIVDCEKASDRLAFGFNAGEGPASVVAGLTIVNGMMYSQYTGWGIHCENSSPRIESCVIGTTSATVSSPSILVRGSGMPVFSRCTFTSTQSGIYMYGGTALFEKCRIKDNVNSSLLTAVAFDLTLGGTAHFRECVFSGNRDTYTYGPRSVRVSAGTANFTDCTFAGNGSVYVYGSAIANFDNCLLAKAGGSSVVIMSNGGTTSLRYCGVNGGSAGVGPVGITGPGGVVNWGDGNFDCGINVGLDATYGLKSTSVCVNKGDPNRTGAGETDIFGNARVQVGRIDVGAAEAALGIELNGPQAGDILACGSYRDIRWAGAAATVDIYYSSNGGTTWTTVATGQPNTGSYRWSVPRRASANSMIAVEGWDGASSVRLESGIFEIRPYMAGAAQDGLWKSIGGDYHRRGLSSFTGPVTGCVRWAFETFEPVGNGVAVGEDGTVYVACDTGILYAVDQDGWMIWGIDLATEITSSPSIGRDGTVYVGCASGELIALSYDGNIRWTYRAGGMIMAAAAVDDAGRVFVASTDGKVYGLGADGSDLWEWQSPHASECRAVVASPTIGADGSVLVCDAYWPVLNSLDAETGSVLWQTDYTLEVPAHITVNGVVVHVPGILGRLMAAPAVGPDGTIYAMFEGYTKLYAIEPNGVRKWDVNLADAASGLFAPYAGTTSGYPLLVQGWAWSEAVVGADGTIYVSLDDPYIRAVGPDGTIRWVVRCGMQGGFKLTVGVDGYIYACGDEGSIYVIAPDGTLASVFDGDGWMSYPVIADDGTVYISDSDGVIWAVGDQCAQGEMPTLRRMADAAAPRGVNFVDYATMLNDWMETTWDYRGIYTSNPSSPKLITGVRFQVTDINRDAYVDIKDIAAMAEQWLEE